MKMKLITNLVGLCFCITLSGQIKIGDNPQNIDPSSVLELESSDRVLVITRITTAQMNNIVPSQGALIYNTDTQCIHLYDGAAWLNLCEAVGLSFTADAVVNQAPTIVLTEVDNNYNFEVGEIRSENIVDFSISSIDIQNNSITAVKLAPDSVGSEELQDNTVRDAEIDYNVVTLADFINDTGYITGADIVSSDAGNSITDNNGAFYDDSPLQNAISANTAAIAADGDTDATNELQDLSLTGNTLAISGTNSVDLSVFDNAGSDDQNLSLSGDILSIEDGNTVDLSGFNNAGTDDQNLTGASLNPGNILQIDIENGSSATVDLTALSGTGTDDQDLTGASLTGNILQIDIEDGASATVDLTPLSGTGTDDQDLTAAFLTGNILQIDIEDGASTTVDLSALSGTGTDDQILILSGNEITIEDGNTIDLTPILGGGSTELADQLTIVGDGSVGNEFEVADGAITSAKITDGTIAAADLAVNAVTTAAITDANVIPVKIQPGAPGDVLSTDLGGNVAWVPVPAGNDDQTAAEVPFTPTGNTISTDVQDAIEELQTEIDGISAGGAANPNDELQTLALNSTSLSLVPPATPDIPVDLDPVFATDAELAALSVDDADADPLNEIQDLNIAADILTITNNVAATPIDLSAYLDNQTLSLAGQDLTIADGNTITLPVADGTETVVNPGTNVAIVGNGSAATPYVISSTDTDDQTLSLTGSDLSISEGNTVALPIADGTETIVSAGTNVVVAGTGSVATPYVISSTDTDDQTLSLIGSDLSISEGNTVTLPIADGTETIVNAGANVTVAGTGSAATPYVVSSTDTDDQTLSIAGQDLTISEGNTVTLPVGDGTETIVTAGTNVTVAGTGSVATPYVVSSTDTDDQTLSIAGQDLTISEGNTVTLPAGDGTETIVTAGTNVTVAGDGSAATPYIVSSTDTDDQTLSVAGNQLTIADGNTVTIPAGDGTETIVTAGANVVIAGTGSAATPYVVSSTDTDDQTAAEVPVAATPTNYAAGSADVEAHLVGIDAALASGGSGENNTASNQGTLGAGVYLQKTGVDLEFKNINAGSNKISITDDLANNEIDIDVVDLNLTITESQISDLAHTIDTDDQDADEVPVAATPANYTSATPDVEAHLAGIDAALAAGGGNPTDELNTLFAVNGANLEITDNGGTLQVPLAQIDTDDQDADEVPVAATPANYTSATPDVEAHLAGIDAALAAGGGNPTDELNTLFAVNGANLEITDNGGTLQVPLAQIDTDDQDADEVTVAATPANYTSATPDVEAHLAGIDAALAAGADTHLGNTDLTQTGGDRTYNQGTQDLIFIGTGDFGIGNGANPPQNKLHVAGAIRSEGILNSFGVQSEPSYRFTNDTDTGMYRPATDVLGFVVGGLEAITIDQVGPNTETVINGSLELQAQLVDLAGNSGTNGQILSSTGGGVDWIDPPSGASITTDGTLTGDGSGGSPLGVANDGIDSPQIADDAVGQSEIEDDAVGTGEIINLTIIDEDISNTAAISGTKIDPDFGNQAIVTTLGLSVGDDILLNGNAIIPDYVFQKYFLGTSNSNERYNFYSLDEIESFVKKNHHLPGIKSAKEVQKDGYWNLSASNLQNLEKIEELFLHTIAQEKKIELLQAENKALSEKLGSIQNDLEEIKQLLQKMQP